MSQELLLSSTLIAEQEQTQQTKVRERSVADYDTYIFPGVVYDNQFHSCATTDFIVEKTGTGYRSLPDLLHAMSENKESGEKVHWADLGGGRGLATHEVAGLAYALDYIDMTSVDLFDPHALLGEDDACSFDWLSSNITTDQVNPRFIQADVQSVKLSRSADLITAVEVVQYLDNPFESIANWYNQLADDGLLVVSADHEWSAWIGYASSTGYPLPTRPAYEFIDTLTRAGIEFAITKDEYDCPGGRLDTDPNIFRRLVIQKRAGTELIVNAPVVEIKPDEDGYKVTYYEKSDSPLIEVISSESRIASIGHQ